jgi:hypothetical protein
MTESADKDRAVAPPSVDGWEQRELEQMRRMGELPMSEKLAWLEEAQRIAEHLRCGGTQADERGLSQAKRDRTADSADPRGYE